jgi:magnesium chelatase family protein
VRRYQARISGPLLDRIDLHVAVPPVPNVLMVSARELGDSTQAALRDAVARARSLQRQRQDGLNSELGGPRVLAAARLDEDGRRLLERASERYALSARGTHRVLRTARTIADLSAEEAVSTIHLSEALSFRALDWNAGLGTAAG